MFQLDHCDDEDSFFELLTHFQSERMDDQRCSLAVPTDDKENTAPANNSNKISPNNGRLFINILPTKSVGNRLNLYITCLCFF